MARVERGNVVLHVDDADVQYYLSLGYIHTDESGKVIAKSVPTNVGELQLAYVEHTKKIEALEAQIADLKTQLDKKTSTKSKKQ